MRITPTAAVLLLIALALPRCAAEADRGQEGEAASTPTATPAPAPTNDEQPALPPRHAMTGTERRAIEEAQSRRARPLPPRGPADGPAQGAMGSTVIGDQPSSPSAPGLTEVERRAAMDDPAVNLSSDPVAKSAELATTEAVAGAKRAMTSPRPGVELRGAVDGLKLVDLAIATEVIRREPTGIDDRFASLPKRFHCFCVFENRQQATQVTHVWKRDGRVVSRVELEVGKSPKWRTWSRQRLQPSWTGNWTCEVHSMSGRTLGIASVQAGG